MSFIDRTKEFFGLAPVDIDSMEHEDAYYADEREAQAAHAAHGSRDQRAYESNGSVAYAPRTYEHDSTPEFEPHIVSVSLVSYKDAMQVGAPFRDGDAVVFELTDADKDNARRLIDFAAGLVTAIDGKMINLTSDLDTDRKVFAILPQGVTVPRVELEEAGRLR
ncbi:cell division protein SepF [uncultured Corynebacterium sp.]|uniref:cell division protein SepF n=1 Tax=uncultured Corynebacterium sp. TaxID=159447 RepID=UPI0025D95997|nr:cell division protein SepF [uncultured Corynebacterium sp.]